MNVLENAVGKSVFGKITDAVFDLQFPWYYGPTAYASEEKKSLYDHSYSHLVLSDGKAYNQVGDMLAMTLYNLSDVIQQDIKTILRIRLGSIPVTPKPIIHTPHVDLEFSHKTALLYLNDSDGDTVFYDLKYPFTERLSTHDYYLKNKKKMKIVETVKPEKNKFIWFDGFNYHSSTSPTKVDRRIVVNFNYVTK
jgi:hypothetical protein